jgi:hypothetical protein
MCWVCHVIGDDCQCVGTASKHLDWMLTVKVMNASYGMYFLQSTHYDKFGLPIVLWIHTHDSDIKKLTF